MKYKVKIFTQFGNRLYVKIIENQNPASFIMDFTNRGYELVFHDHMKTLSSAIPWRSVEVIDFERIKE